MTSKQVNLLILVAEYLDDLSEANKLFIYKLLNKNVNYTIKHDQQQRLNAIAKSCKIGVF